MLGGACSYMEIGIGCLGGGSSYVMGLGEQFSIVLFSHFGANLKGRQKVFLVFDFETVQRGRRSDI